jgi:tetratricopeptide (TPR) repeat protein
MSRHRHRTRTARGTPQKHGSGQALDPLFAKALQHHQDGRLLDAGQLYRQVLAREPQHAESLHMLGIVAYQGGQYEAAIEFFGQAIAIRDDVPFYHNNLGNAFKALRRLEAAAACYRRAIALKPDFAAACNNLGYTLKDQGLFDAALEQYRQAIALEPKLADVHNNLGVVLQELGRRDEASAAFREAILLRPDYAEAHNNFGNLLRDQGQLDAAADQHRQAIALKPGGAEAHYNLAGVLQSQGRLEAAAASYEQALRVKPDFAEAYNNLGNLLRDWGRLDEAVARYRQAIVARPDYPEAYNNLGNALKDQGQLVDAMAHYRQAISLRPDFAEAHNNLGTAFQDQGWVDMAVAHYQRALALKPDYAEAHYNLGVALQDRGLLEEAVARYRQALLLRPDFPEACNNLGNTLKDLGRIQEALAQYEQALAVRPDFAEAHYNRVELKRIRPGDPDLAVLEALVADNDRLPAGKAPFIHFALAKALEEVDEPARAFQHLLIGNALKRQQVSYDEAATHAVFARIATVFDAGLFLRHRGAGAPSAVPIFVLGMPRSGSSLVEQILASHPEVHGAGELSDLAAVVNGVADGNGEFGGYPESIGRLDDAALERLGSAYLARLPALPAGKTRITDKMPYNFLYVGLIRLALPGARIIHTERNPADTCVSCFSKLFPTGQAYSYDLGELGRYYRAYRGMMAHWRSVLPEDAMLDVSYEAVVEDLEGQARRLVAWCGLPWNDRCLDFHETRRPVRTASAVQVRQPLFRSSLQRWRRYEAWLQPLLRELDDQTGRLGVGD